MLGGVYARIGMSLLSRQEQCALCVSTLSLLLVAAAVAEPSAPSKDGSTARYRDSSNGCDWPGYGRTFGEQHDSPLTQINRDTIGRLGLAWSMDLEPTENSVTQPIAVDGVLYFATGHSVVHAVDAASGRFLWRFDPKVAEAAGFRLRLAYGSRGIAWWNGKIYTGTQDGRLIAIDAKTGKQLWSVQTLSKGMDADINAPPRVFDGKVIIGFSGDVFANRGYVTTYDAETGKQLWRFYTVPGDPAKGFENKAMEMAAKTWAGDWWRLGGGGNVWNAMTYDLETNTVYLGVGNGYPWNRRARSKDWGDNLFISSIVALDGTTGEYKWHYQVSPGDSWDHEPMEDMELADLILSGKPRKVLLQASKNGFFYVIDRVTGELISAKPYAKVTWASRIDIKTGRPVENPGIRYPDGTTAEIWPSSWGAHGWVAMAYSPKTRIAFIPVIEVGYQYTDKGIDVKNWRPPANHYSIDLGLSYTPTNGTGALVAWNPVTQKELWKVPHPTNVNGGVMVTAGDVVFQGTIDGTFKAYAAATGRVLWSFAAQAPLLAAPISYAVNGTQYVTLLTGLGTGAGLMASEIAGAEKYGIDPRSQARRVLTFALDGKATLPPALTAIPPAIEDPGFKHDARSAAAGEMVFDQSCLICHGQDAVGAIHAPDLRRSAIPLSDEAFTAVVRGGLLTPKGMPTFAELTNEQLANLREYIRTRAAKLRNRNDTKNKLQ
jgi:quinohemoprotein ethanol dehydrogenase